MTSETFIRAQFAYFSSHYNDTILLSKRPGPERDDTENVMYSEEFPVHWMRFFGTAIGLLSNMFRVLPIIGLYDIKQIGRDWTRIRGTDRIHLVNFGMNVFLPLMLRELGIIDGPIVVHFHGSDISRYFDRQRRYRRRLLRAMQMVDHVIVVGAWMKERLEAHGITGDRISIIPCGVDIHGISATPLEESDSCHFIFVGRLAPYKGAIEVLESFRRIYKEIPKATLTIVGDGPQYGALHDDIESSSIADRVNLLGWTPHKNVLKLLRESSVFVQHCYDDGSGTIEGWNISVAEASYCGLPVVTTRFGGIPDHQIDGKTGYLVEVGDIEGFSERMLKLAKDPSLRQKMGIAGSMHIREVGDSRKQLTKLESCLISVNEQREAIG